MPQLIYKQRKYVMPNLGDMIHRITIYDREIKTPVQGNIDYTLDFSKMITVWASIESVVGIVVFDSVNMDRTISHKMLIRYLPFITQEHWIEFKGKYYDIVNVEDLNEEKRFQVLRCNLRGKAVDVANEA